MTLQMSTWMPDVRFALRSFAKNPWFTLAAVLSLAIGIGANTSIFSVSNALLLRPLPYQDPDRLVILWNRSPGLGITQDWFSTAQYFDIKTGHHGFEQVAIAIGGNYNLTGAGRAGTRGSRPRLLESSAHARRSCRRQAASSSQMRIHPAVPPPRSSAYGMWTRRYGRRPAHRRQIHPDQRTIL